MAFLGMGGFDDDPNQDIVPEGVHGFEKDLKKDILSNVTSLIVYSCVDLSIMDKKQPPAMISAKPMPVTFSHLDSFTVSIHTQRGE